MPAIHIRFYEELNEYLPAEKRRKRFVHTIQDLSRSGDIIESLGIPLKEVDLLMVNDESVDFSQILNDGDFVSVYPVFESVDIGSLTRLPSRPLRKLRFVLDVHLGKLARNLRLLGFDSLYRPDFTNDRLVNIMKREKRVILTRNRRLMEDTDITHGYRVRESNPDNQTVEVLCRFDLLTAIHPFTLCVECNEPLEETGKDVILEDLPPKIRQDFDRFNHCPVCGRNYWQGSHFEKMNAFVIRIKRKVQESQSE